MVSHSRIYFIWNPFNNFPLQIPSGWVHQPHTQNDGAWWGYHYQIPLLIDIGLGERICDNLGEKC